MAESMLLDPTQFPEPGPASTTFCMTAVKALFARALQSLKGFPGTTLRWPITVSNVAPAGAVTKIAPSANAAAKHAMREQVIVSKKPPRPDVVGPWNAFPLRPRRIARIRLRNSHACAGTLKRFTIFRRPRAMTRFAPRQFSSCASSAARRILRRPMKRLSTARSIV